MRDDGAMEKAQGALHNIEHSLAWLMAGVAIFFGVIAMLVGFGVLDFRGGEAGIQIGEAAVATTLPTNFLDGAMLLFTAITAAILAYTLHSGEHHSRTAVRRMSTGDRAVYSTEHGLAYVMAIAAIALVVLGLLVGYGAFNITEPQLNGLLWIWGGFGAGILTATLHAVRHHQMTEADEIVAIVTERVRMTESAGPVTTEPQRRPTR